MITIRRRRRINSHVAFDHAGRASELGGRPDQRNRGAIRILLRRWGAAALRGRQRAEAIPECAGAGTRSRQVGLRARPGDGTSFPGRVLAQLGPDSCSWRSRCRRVGSGSPTAASPGCLSSTIRVTLGAGRCLSAFSRGCLSSSKSMRLHRSGATATRRRSTEARRQKRRSCTDRAGRLGHWRPRAVQRFDHAAAGNWLDEINCRLTACSALEQKEVPGSMSFFALDVMTHSHATEGIG